MKKIKIIVLGRYGQVATNLFELFELKGENSIFNTTFYTSKDVDFSFPEKVQTFLEENVKECDYIINCAAYNHVDKAEIEQELCDNINHQSVKKIAEFCASKNIKFIHYSSDYVFDGKDDLPFDEENTENLYPVNYYGKTKLAGEISIKESGCQHIIFRVSWVYDTSSNFKNFFNTIKNLSKKEEEIKIVNDQIGSPTSAYFIASNTIRIIKKIDSSLSSFPSGIYHLNNGRFISWYEMATEIIDSLRQDKEIVKIKTITPIASSEYKTSATRPLNSRLDNKKVIKTFNLELGELQKKYIAVFAHFDKDNIIDDYVLFYLKGLKEVCNKIIFVSDCDLPKEEIDKLDNLCFHVIAKKHGEYDFGSYKRGFFFAKESGVLEDCDELIFANDSCYGPIRPLAPIFRSMEYRFCDFWGMTINQECYKPHIQSYFISFGKKVFFDKKFIDFVMSIRAKPDKTSIIENYEITLSRLLIESRYLMSSLDPTYHIFNQNSIHNSLRSVLKNKYIPFVKINTLKAELVAHGINRPSLRDYDLLIKYFKNSFKRYPLHIPFISITEKTGYIITRIFGIRIFKKRSFCY